MDKKRRFTLTSVCLVVVTGQHSHAEDSLGGRCLVVSTSSDALFEHIVNGLVSHDFVREVAAQQQAVFVLTNRSHIAGPNCELVLVHDNCLRIVVISATDELQTQRLYALSHDHVEHGEEHGVRFQDGSFCSYCYVASAASSFALQFYGLFWLEQFREINQRLVIVHVSAESCSVLANEKASISTVFNRWIKQHVARHN
jgi:hypothetical protein